MARCPRRPELLRQRTKEGVPGGAALFRWSVRKRPEVAIAHPIRSYRAKARCPSGQVLRRWVSRLRSTRTEFGNVRYRPIADIPGKCFTRACANFSIDRKSVV